MSPDTTFCARLFLQEGGLCRGRNKKNWMDKVKEWTFLHTDELFLAAKNRPDWRRI
ncbi:hypothetical protein DPMN_035084 [Dreissena polymorpha]|uniref:Uncharacterized protein n=1 Tax=Dreissena polymorpha TaxID=45954 RepID=A0A9D4M9W1_DREPO|nr:hypothetical protein DPMN_035084 [Dreissena polymorpha]